MFMLTLNAPCSKNDDPCLLHNHETNKKIVCCMVVCNYDKASTYYGLMSERTVLLRCEFN